MRTARTVAGRVLAACGTLLLAAAAIAWATGGFAFTLGPLHVSATDPARLLMEGAVALLAWAAVTLERPDRRAAVLVTCVVMTYYIALVAESSPRRVGDGHEYIAMARQLSALRPASVSRRDIDTVAGEMAALPGYGPTDLREPTLVAADGRQDFHHFWLYPLAVAPVLAVVRATGLHWNHAFTIVNITLLAVFAWCALSTLGTSATILLACSPIIWWIDKAHIEVFNFALLGTALVLCRKAPRTALLLLGVLTAQNPGFALILVPVAVALLWTAPATERHSLAAAAAGAGLIAAMHPAYYFWRFGGPTPLSTALSYNWPGLTAIVTPIIDPDLGLCWWFPGLLVTLGINALGRKKPSRAWVPLAAVSIGFLLMLLLVAASGNVNHGATPGMSRYAIWLAPFAIVAFRTDGGDGLRGWLLAVVSVASAGQIAWTSHPKTPENSLAPTSASIWVSDHLPRLYNPVPEVFSERYTGVDGAVPLPVSSHECGKVLLSGLAHETVRWPIPCRPAPIPEKCRESGVLCYANRAQDGYVFDIAPRQPGFGFIPEGAPDLLWRGPSDFDWLPVRIAWWQMSSVLPLGNTSPIRGTTGIGRIFAFQNPRDFVAFITMPELRIEEPRMHLEPSGSGDELWWLDLDRKVTTAHQPLRDVSWVDVPSPSTRLLVVRRGDAAR
jgi:hypothetical protein